MRGPSPLPATFDRLNKTSYTSLMAQPARKLPPFGGASETPDPFRYGSRWRRVRLANGEVTDQEIPLTPDDLLDPELGDEVTQSKPHAKAVTTLNELLERHFDDDPDVQVLFDMKIFWGLPGLPNPSPDIAVVRGAREDEGRSTFDVVEEGVLPCLILEVVSYSDAEMYRNDHEKKVELYQRVGIPEYLIVDPSFSSEAPLLLTGYRLASDGRYRRIEPDSSGRLHSETTSLFFAPSEDGRTVRVGDAETGEWLLTAREEKTARIRESKARKAAEKRADRETEQRKAAEAELAHLRAELERLKEIAE
jgi:Uma2 family endonuclease